MVRPSRSPEELRGEAAELYRSSDRPWAEMTRSQLRTARFAHIETFYNRQRHQARLDHRTSADAHADETA